MCVWSCYLLITAWNCKHGWGASFLNDLYSYKLLLRGRKEDGTCATPLQLQEHRDEPTKNYFLGITKGEKVIWKCNRMLEGCLPSIDNDENAPIPNVTQWFLNLRASLLWRKDVGNPAKILPCGHCGYAPARMWGYSNSHRVTGF